MTKIAMYKDKRKNIIRIKKQTKNKINEIIDGYHESNGSFLNKRYKNYNKRTFWEVFQKDPQLCINIEKGLESNMKISTIIFTHIMKLKQIYKKHKRRLIIEQRFHETLTCFEQLTNKDNHIIYENIKDFLGN